MNMNLIRLGTMFRLAGAAVEAMAPAVDPWLSKKLRGTSGSAEVDLSAEEEADTPDGHYDYLLKDQSIGAQIEVQSPTYHIAVAESAGLNGGRYDGIQQDRTTGRAVTRDDLTHVDAEYMLLDAYSFAEQKTLGVKGAGTTALTAMVTPDGFLTMAQLGDCALSVYVRNLETGEIFKGLEGGLPMHTASNPDEVVRVQQEGGRIEMDGNTPRLNGSVIVTRSFGDYDVGAGMSATPEILKADLGQFLTSGKHEVFVVLGSDGLTGIDNQANMNGLYKEQQTLSQSFLALNLVNDSYDEAVQERGAGYKTDNVAAAVLKIHPEDYKSEVSFLGVMDGHGKGGENIAETVKNSITHYLENTLQEISPSLSSTMREAADPVIEMPPAAEPDKSAVSPEIASKLARGGRQADHLRHTLGM